MTILEIGYCTNVHAGADWAQTQSNLAEHAVAVQKLADPSQPVGVGLWLSANSAAEMLRTVEIQPFRDWLGQNQLLPFTMNGFPHGDFHQPVVKHLVYEPTWMEDARRDYTDDLITILHGLLPEGQRGSISTLPIAWGKPRLSDEQWQQAAANFNRIATRLAQLEQETGRWIQICIEPEPGCAIQYSQDIVEFFEKHLLPAGREDQLRRYITVCHDVCHAAVMFEDQRAVFERFVAAGIDVGKVQVSAAVAIPLATMAPSERAAALQQLSEFAEEKYLHQTSIKGPAGDTFYEDLHLALADQSAVNADEWRVHFHVPIYLDRFGHLQATQSAILECLKAAAATMPHLTHFEVETYAWGVLPSELQQPTLADGIARELRWFRDQVAQL